MLHMLKTKVKTADVIIMHTYYIFTFYVSFTYYTLPLFFFFFHLILLFFFIHLILFFFHNTLDIIK